MRIQDLGDGRANGLACRWGGLFPPGGFQFQGPWRCCPSCRCQLKCYELTLGDPKVGEPCLEFSDFRADAFQGPSAILDDPSAWPERVIAMTLVNFKLLIERDRELKITWPDGHVSHDAALQVLAAAA